MKRNKYWVYYPGTVEVFTNKRKAWKRFCQLRNLGFLVTYQEGGFPKDRSY